MMMMPKKNVIARAIALVKIKLAITTMIAQKTISAGMADALKR